MPLSIRKSRTNPFMIAFNDCIGNSANNISSMWIPLSYILKWSILISQPNTIVYICLYYRNSKLYLGKTKRNPIIYSYGSKQIYIFFEQEFCNCLYLLSDSLGQALWLKRLHFPWVLCKTHKIGSTGEQVQEAVLHASLLSFSIRYLKQNSPAVFSASLSIW